MKIKKVSIFLAILASLGILAGSIVYKKTNQISPIHQKSTNSEIPAECIQRLLIGHLLGYMEPLKSVNLAELTAEEKNELTVREGDIFNWKPIGVLPNGNQIVYVYYWPDGAMGKFSGLYVVRYFNNTLYFVAEIAWGERHSSGICEEDFQLNGNQLTYSRHMSSFQFFDYMLEIFPDLFELAEHKSREGLCYGEAGYLGFGTFKVDIAPDGKLTNEQLLSFNAAIAGLGQEENLSLNSLSMIDAFHHVFVKCAIKEGCSEVIQIEKKHLEQLIKEAISYARNEDDIPKQDSEGLAGYQSTNGLY